MLAEDNNVMANEEDWNPEEVEKFDKIVEGRYYH